MSTLLTVTVSKDLHGVLRMWSDQIFLSLVGKLLM